jgi:hypothetical protein
LTGTITLSTALPDLSTDIILAGPGPSALTVARSGAAETPAFRIFNVTAGANVEISGLTVTGGLVLNVGTDGLARGGGIENLGTLSISDVTVSGNTAGKPGPLSSGTPGEGGGIDNAGKLSITDATIIGNSAIVVSILPNQGLGFIGGGINNTGTLSLTHASFTNNSGGAIQNSGNLSVTGSIFDDNTGGGTGAGAIGNSGVLSVTDSTFSGNTSYSGGGGIKNSGTASLVNSVFSGNATHNLGGAGAYNAGTLLINGVTFTGNAAEGGGGAILNFGNLTVTSSTFARNSAKSTFFGNRIPSPGSGGAIFNQATASITNSTFYENSVQGLIDSFYGLFGGEGGGIFNSSMLTLAYVTIDGNAAIADESGRPGSGGGVATDGQAAEVTSIDSIFENSQGGNVSVTSGAIFRSLGHNLFSDSPNFADTRTDLINTNALLGPLADNGGPTPTQALPPGSPAIDAGVSIPNTATDQRGVPRPQGYAPDIGAFESPYFASPRVVNLQRLGVHMRPTEIVVTFSEPMDASSAEAMVNYRLVSAGPDHRFGTRDDRAIHIRSVRYDATLHTVTLRPIRRLPLRRTFQLTINGTPPTGLKDTAGVFLDGAGTGHPGTDYVARINAKLLVPPISNHVGGHTEVAHRLTHR